MYWMSITLVSPIFYIELHQMHIKSWTFLTCIYLEAKKNVLDVDLPSLIYIYKDDTGKLNVSTEDRFMVTDRF